MNIFEQYDDRLRTLETILDADKPVKLRQAHITSTSPLAVKYSGETLAHPIQYAITSNYGVGDHVVVAIQNGAAYLLGTLGQPENEGVWHDLVLTDTTNFALLTTPIRYRRKGGRVTVSGTLRITTANHIDGTSKRIFAQLPVGYRPPIVARYVTQGDNLDRLLLEIGTNGALGVARYGPGAQTANRHAYIYAEWGIE